MECKLTFQLFKKLNLILQSTPLYQILQQALPDKSNKTKFTLIYSNLTPVDILLKEEFDEWAKKYPKTFKVIYAVDKPDDKWKGMSSTFQVHIRNVVDQIYVVNINGLYTCCLMTCPNVKRA